MLKKVNLNYRAERHDLKSQFLILILLFFLPSFLGGKRKGEKNNQSRSFKSCFSARSFEYLIVRPSIKHAKSNLQFISL